MAPVVHASGPINDSRPPPQATEATAQIGDQGVLLKQHHAHRRLTKARDVSTYPDSTR
ncbi:hypothetical protein [Haloglycomyces albus]|uniref:hypothetical protein n=1 Tax=Haloglycomyces albus TaxID=526067 RepID=UPI0004B15216|nr:hypothetical protein [Haloglycomyces albus]